MDSNRLAHTKWKSQYHIVMTDIEGAIVTADAMSCQKKIVEKIIKQKADYIIGLKQNQPALYQDTEDYFKEYAKEMPCEVTLDQGTWQN